MTILVRSMGTRLDKYYLLPGFCSKNTQVSSIDEQLVDRSREQPPSVSLLPEYITDKNELQGRPTCSLKPNSGGCSDGIDLYDPCEYQLNTSINIINFLVWLPRFLGDIRGVFALVPLVEMSVHDGTSAILRAKHADFSVATSSEGTFTTSSTSPTSSPSPSPSPYAHVSTPYMGQVFAGDEAAYNFYKAFSKNSGFSIRRQKATRNRGPHDKSIVSRYFVCHRAGYPSQKVDKNTGQRNSSSMRCKCGAGMEIKRLLSDDSRWIVTHFTNVHNHDLLDPDKVCLPAYQKITEYDRTQITILAKVGVTVKQILNYLELEHGVELGCLQFLEKDVRNFIQSFNLVVNESEQDLSMPYSNASIVKANSSNSNQSEQQVQTLQSIASEVVTEFCKGRAGFEFIRDEMTKVRDLTKRLQLIGNIASSRRSNSLSETDGYNDGRALSSEYHPFLVIANGGLTDKKSKEGAKLLKKPRYCKVPSCGQPGHDSRNCPMKRSVEMDVNIQTPVSLVQDPVQAVSSATSMNENSNGGNYSAKKPRHCKVPSCGQIGHDSRNCPLKSVAQLEINYEAPSSNGTSIPEESKGDVSSAKKPRFCKVPSCGQDGHDSRNCPMKRALSGVQSTVGNH